MGRAGRIDHQPVRRIGRDDRRVKPKRPQRQPIEGFGVGRKVCIHDDQARNERLRLGRRHADPQTGALCRRIRGQHHPPPSITADQDQRRFSRRRGGCPASF